MELGLTRLGNILLSPASYIYHQYGASMKLAWPIIENKLSEEDEKLIKTIQGNWTALLFFISLLSSTLFVVLEMFIISAFSPKSLNLWVLLALVIFAIVFYSASLPKARLWGEGMRQIFDLHIKDVFSSLGMDELKNLTPASPKFKSQQESVFSWLAYGGGWEEHYQAEETWYTKPAALWPKLIHPEFLKVEALPRFTNRKWFVEDGKYYEQNVTYFFTVTNTSTGENPLSGKESYLLIQDAGVSPPNEVEGDMFEVSNGRNKNIKIKGIKQVGRPAGLLFLLGEIPPGSSRNLTYSFDSVFARIETNLPDADIQICKNKNEQYIEVCISGGIKKGKFLKIELLNDEDTKLNRYLIPIKSGKMTPNKISTTITIQPRGLHWRFDGDLLKVDKLRILVD